MLNENWKLGGWKWIEEDGKSEGVLGDNLKADA